MMAWSTRSGLGCIALLVLVVALAGSPGAQAEERTLSSVVRDVSSKHQSLAHIHPSDLATRLTKPNDIVLFDVREEEEFAVSHLDGAIRVSPGIWRSTFLSRYRETLAGKTVVFYCSVGVRSSSLAESVKGDLLASGIKEVANLEGGIFAWHNQSRPLVDGQGRTEFVHPYDAYWGRLLTRQDLARKTARP